MFAVGTVVRRKAFPDEKGTILFSDEHGALIQWEPRPLCSFTTGELRTWWCAKSVDDCLEEVKPEQWVNLYWFDKRHGAVSTGGIFPSEKEAKRSGRGQHYITTIRIDNINKGE